MNKDIKKGSSKDEPNKKHNHYTMKERVLSILTDRPQTKEDLCKRLNISERGLREAIKQLRDDGYVVAGFSNRKGYYIGDEEDRQHLIAEYKKRAYEMLRTARILERGEIVGQMRIGE